MKLRYLIAIAALLCVQTAHAQKAPKDDAKTPQVLSALVDFETMQLGVSGSNFLDGKTDVLVAELGGIPLSVLTLTDSTFTAELPQELGDGDYLLLVYNDNGAGAYALTLGAVGPVGPTGATGADGPPGPEGPVGASGPEGPPGPMGPEGPVGATGATGATGAEGPPGPEGPMGASGPEGPPGPMGPEGPVGPIGPQGVQGSAGPMGPQGLQGETGPIGPQGPEGPAGPEGLPGANGVIGYRVVQFERTRAPGGNPNFIEHMFCDYTSGERALSGGYFVYNNQIVVQGSRPGNAGIPSVPIGGVWSVNYVFPEIGGTVITYVVCAKVE